MRSRILSIFLALLVISSGVAGPVAAQTHSSPDCDSLMGFIQNAISVGLTGEKINTCSSTNQAVEEMKESDGNQTKVDIYEGAVSQRAAQEDFLTTYNNYLNDTENTAWMKMQVAVAEAYQNGSTKSVAKSKARQAISNYYATKQKNLINKFNSSVATHNYLRETAKNESDVQDDFVFLNMTATNSDSSITGVQKDTKNATTVTLVNGNSYSTANFELDITTKYSTSVGSNSQTDHYDLNPTLDPDQSGGQHGVIFYGLDVRPPDSNYDRQRYLTFTKYHKAWDAIERANSGLQNESDNFVEATYADFDSGAINASDVISANTAMFEYGTENDGNSSLYDSTAALTMMGFDTPNMSSSGTMDVSYEGNTYTGIVLARDAPGGSWETGTTYNTSNITGPVFVATTDGQKVDFAEGSTFTIEQMRAKDGTNTTSIETTEYVYKTANTSELNEMQSQLTDLRAEIEAREPSGGGGSGSGIGTNTIIAGAALAGAALLFGRSNQ